MKQWLKYLKRCQLTWRHWRHVWPTQNMLSWTRGYKLRVHRRQRQHCSWILEQSARHRYSLVSTRTGQSSRSNSTAYMRSVNPMSSEGLRRAALVENISHGYGGDGTVFFLRITIFSCIMLWHCCARERCFGDGEKLRSQQWIRCVTSTERHARQQQSRSPASTDVVFVTAETSVVDRTDDRSSREMRLRRERAMSRGSASLWMNTSRHVSYLLSTHRSRCWWCGTHGSLDDGYG